jgi:hypothetical protein
MLKSGMARNLSGGPGVSTKPPRAARRDQAADRAHRDHQRHQRIGGDAEAHVQRAVAGADQRGLRQQKYQPEREQAAMHVEPGFAGRIDGRKQRPEEEGREKPTTTQAMIARIIAM